MSNTKVIEICDNSVFAVKNVITDMNKLEVCTKLIESIKDKRIERNVIEAAGLLNAYKRVSQYVTSKGKKGSFKNDKIKSLAKLVGYQLDISIDYSLKNINS